VNTSGVADEDQDEIEFHSFGERRKSLPDLESEESDGDEIRDRTEILSKSNYAPPSPEFSIGDSEDEVGEELCKKRRRLALLEIALLEPNIDLDLVDEKVDSIMSSYRDVEEDSNIIQALDTSIRNLIMNYCARKGYLLSSQQATSSASSPATQPVEEQDDDRGNSCGVECEAGESTVPVLPYYPRFEMPSIGTSNPVLLSESDLPNKHLTAKLTVQKVTKYVAAVQALTNSNVHYKENREALDEKVKVILDLYWGVSTSEIKTLAKNWRSLELSSFKRFVIESITRDNKSYDADAFELPVKKILQKGVKFSAEDVSNFVDKIAEIQMVWNEVPKHLKESEEGMTIQNQLLRDFHKNFSVVQGVAENNDAHTKTLIFSIFYEIKYFHFHSPDHHL
jgi:hypothetical protein